MDKDPQHTFFTFVQVLPVSTLRATTSSLTHSPVCEELRAVCRLLFGHGPWQGLVVHGGSNPGPGGRFRRLQPFWSLVSCNDTPSLSNFPERVPQSVSMSRVTVSPRRWSRQPALRRRHPEAAAGTVARRVGVPDITTYSARWNTHISYTRQPPASSRRAQLAPGPGARGSGVNGCSCCSMVFYFAFLVGFAVVFLIVLPGEE